MFDWKDYQAIAEFLSDKSKHTLPLEAAQRAAISRAYFACFGKILTIERDDRSFEATGEAEDHGRLKYHLRRNGKKHSAIKLEKLREWRNDADYKEAIDNLDRMCENAIDLAKELINRH